MIGEPTDALLEQQTDYYRTRAPRSDDWFFRRGRHDRGPIINRQWFVESIEVLQALSDFGISGTVLELGGGTGYWTQHLAITAKRVTVVEVSVASNNVSRARLGSFVNRVHHVDADVYRWRPPEEYDAVFFAFWLSHVPPHMVEAFWRFLRTCLKPGGRVFIVETLRSENAIANDHRLPPKGSNTAVRKREGREQEVYKTFYTPESLSNQLAGFGWDAKLRRTKEFFLYGSAIPRPE